MTHRLFARLHAWLTTLLSIASGRLRGTPERGQGTVEYVALILLVAGVLAVAVAAADASGKSFDFGEIVTTELKQAIGKVSK